MTAPALDFADHPHEAADRPAERAPADASETPSLPAAAEIAAAFAGFAVLGLCAGLGSGDVGTSVRAVPSGLLVGMGALVLTGPALVAAHQFLGLRGRPEALITALARGFVLSGKTALGLAPAMLFFSATSGLWAVVFTVLLLGIGGLGFAFTARRLLETEPRGNALVDLRILSLVASWVALCALIAARLAWDVAWFVLG